MEEQEEMNTKQPKQTDIVSIEMSRLSTNTSDTVDTAVCIGQDFNDPKVIVSFLDYFSNRGDSNTTETMFYCNQEPPLSLEDFIKRIYKYTSHSITFHVVYLLWKIHQKYSNLFHRRSLHKIFLVCFTISSKFSEDLFHSQSFYSRVGGVNIEELNMLELYVLKDLIEWELCPCYKEFNAFITQRSQLVERGGCRKRALETSC